MAETLRELVVSLSLQSDNFSKNIKSINAQIREVESRFNQAGAGVDGFAKSTDGLKAKAASLTERLKLQSTAVEQFETQLKRATDTLEKNKAKHDALKTTLTDQKAKYAALKAEMDKAEAAHKASIKTTGDNSEESVRLGVALEDLKTEYGALGAEIKKNEGELSRNTNTLQNNANAVTRTSDGLNKARGAQKELRAELEKTNRAIKTHQAAWLNAAENLDRFGNRATASGQKLSRAGALLSATVTAPIVALGGAAIKASIDWETAFAGVEKTVDGTDEELKQLNDELLALSEILPTSREELAAIAEEGGQFGLVIGNIRDFVKVAADLKESTNLGDEGASQLAKFQGLVKMSENEFSNAGSALVELGNNSKTTERDIMSMSMRLSGAGTTVGMMPPDILGVSAAFSSLGIEAEAGGTAISKLINDMQLAVETGSDALGDYAGIAKMTAAEFQQAFREDAVGALGAFIEGLSTGGDSAIKILDEIGISEVRMRDALLRATNAGDLFSRSVQTANRAWKENTALTIEANKRYATTASRLEILKNRAINLAGTLGDDLSPIVDDLIEMAGGWIDKLNEMEPAQRQTLMTTAAWLAAVGPGVMIVGKMNTAVGSLTTGLSGLIKTSVDAGGGLKGFFAASKSLLGPAGIAALTAAVIYGAYKWHDYASGAKAAREATEAIMETAQRWKETQALTIFDTGNDPLARFGLTRESFAGGVAELDNWLSRLTATWSDGKKETREIVKRYVDEFVAGSDEIREAIKKRQETQEKYGVTGDESLESALKTLQGYDAEIEKLLKKRQNKMLSEDDQARLEQIIQERVELQLKFVTGEGGSYQSLAEAVEAEKARLASEGKEPGADLYGDAIMGAAEGYQAQVDAINQSYHDQYAALKAITDEDERLGAIKALNAEHTRSLAAAQGEYNDLVAQFAPEAFESEEVQKAKEDMETLRQMISEGASPEALTAFVETLDEGQLASYIALLKQMEEADLSNLNLSKDGEPAVTVSDLLGGYDTIADYLKGNAGALGSIGELLGAAGEEASRVLVDMVLTPEGQTLKDWLDGNKEFTLSGTLTGLPESVTINATAPVTLTNIPDTISVGATSPVTLTDVPDSITIDADAPVTITGLPDGPLTIPANSPTTLTGLPESITVQCDAPVNLSDVPGSITVQADAPVTLTNVPEDIGIPSATIQSVGFADGITIAAPIIPDVPVKAKITYDDFSGVERSAIDKYFADNPDKKPSIVTNVGLQPGWAAALKAAYDSGNLEVFGPDGAPLPVTPDVVGGIGPSDIWIAGFDAEGNPTITVGVVYEPGTKEATDAAREELEKGIAPQGDVFGQKIDLPDWLGSMLSADTMQKIRALTADLNQYDGFWDWFGAGKTRLEGNIEDLDSGTIETYVQGIVAAIQNGEEVSEEDLNHLRDIMDLIDALDTAGMGEGLVSDIGDAMAAAGWDTSAGTVASNLEDALNEALKIGSPAKALTPVGTSIVAGIVKGVEDDTYKLKAAMVKMAREAVNAAKNELKIESPSRVLRDEVGVMMARGVGRGLTLGGKEQERIIANAARQMADAGVAGVRSDNRRTYNQQNTVSLAGANLYVRDDQDIYALATEIATLTKRQQRASGARMA